MINEITHEEKSKGLPKELVINRNAEYKRIKSNMKYGSAVGINQEDREYEKDLLADGHFVADGKRRLRQETLDWGTEKMNDSKKSTLEELLNLWYIHQFGTPKDLYYMPEEDENGNVIVDKENKRIKFIDKPTGKVIYMEYVDNTSEELLSNIKTI